MKTTEEPDYKKLWFEICEEKKQLQIENYRLKKEIDYVRKELSKIEKFYYSLTNKKWNETGKKIMEMENE